MKKRRIFKSFRVFDFKAGDDKDINDDSEETYLTDNTFYIQMIGINELGESCCCECCTLC